MLSKSEFSLRKRFVKDFNLPINLVDSPYFEYYMDRYDFFPKEEWKNCLQTIETSFDGNADKWLENYSQIRDNIIKLLKIVLLSKSLIM